MKKRIISFLMSIAMIVGVAGCNAGNNDNTSHKDPHDEKYTVTWKNYDGTILETDVNVSYGEIPSYDSEIPTRSNDAQYTYVFSGWSPVVEAVTKDAVYTAVFDHSVNKYTVTWLNFDNSVLETDYYVPYGDIPTYDGIEPTKPGDNYYDYVFDGWSPDVSTVKCDATYVAQFKSVLKHYKVTWKNYDDSILKVDSDYTYGEMPSYNGEEPKKPDEGKYNFVFSGWSPEVTEITQNAEYTAQFTPVEKTFTIIWKNWDGSILETDSNVPYGEIPTYDGVTPLREKDAQYTYVFCEWSPEIKEATEDTVYIAEFDTTINTYTVVWKNWDGSILETDSNVPYGEIPTFDGTTPEKDSNSQYTYSFVGWSPTVEEVTCDIEYTAQFEDTINKYSVTWKNYDGSILQVDAALPYGTMPSFNGATPTKPQDKTYYYAFTGWSPTVEEVTCDIEYTAQFEAITRTSFEVLFDANGGEGAPSGMMKSLGVDLTIPSEIPVLDHYKFCGWNCLNNNIIYQPGDKYKLDEDVRFFAMWCEHCHSCDGVGTITTEHTCSACSGKGTITTTGQTFVYCTSCGGKGSITITYETACSSCKGLGGRYLCTCSSGHNWWWNDVGTKTCPYCGKTAYKTEKITTCSTCGGKGSVKTSKTSTCTACNGTGGKYVTTTSTKTCSSCNGSGKISNTNTCSSCGGEGLIIPSAPTLKSMMYKQVVLYEKTGYEYKYDGGEWQSSNVFDNLTPNTLYRFYQRVASSDTKPFGITSKALSVTTSSIPNYSISYTLNGGVNSANNPKNYTPETPTFELSDPSRDGYSFVGWTGSNGDIPQKSVAIEYGSSGNLHFTANWEANVYRITFVTNGGESISPLDIACDDAVELPAAHFDNKTFVGWYDESLENEIILSKMPAHDVTLYAKWKDYDIELNYDSLSAVNVSKEINASLFNAEAIDTDGDTVSVNADIVSGNMIPGDYIDVQLSASGKYGNVKSITITNILVLDTEQSLLTLVKDGNNVDSILVNKGENYVLPVYQGYDTGWYLDNTLLTDNEGHSLVPWDKDSGEYFLFAEYAPISYSITYDLNGGTNNKNNPDSYTIESQNITIQDPTREGYSFQGWTNETMLEPTKNPEISNGSIGNKVYVANWTANSYSISLNANGGQLDGQNNISVTFDDSYSLPTPTRVGYTFAVWFEGDVQYSGGSWTTARDVQLTAKWVANTDTVYVVNHYQQNVDDDNYTLFETEYLTGTSDSSVSPSVKSYSGFTAPSKQTTSIAPDGSTVVNYYYNRNTYSLTIIWNDGSKTTESTKVGADLYNKYGNNRGGKVFGGFFTDEKLTNELTIMPSYNQTVYAWWEGETKPNDFSYTKSSSSVTITGYSGSATSVVIPSYIGGIPVTAIAEKAFENCSSITSVVVPNSVTSIGQGAFKGCNALTSITLPFVGGSNSVTSYSSPSTNFGYIFGYTTSSTASGTTQSGSGSQRFYVPTTLKTVTITNAKGISDYAFHNYNWITTINLNNSITSIGSYAFYGCSSLSTFTIPSKVTSIGSYAFYNCSKISSITLPSGLKTISDYAFYGCKFSNFTIPASVTSIGAHAFENNTTLTEIVIPGTVLTIGDNAFSGCSNVATLSLNSGTTTIGEYSFQNLSKITSVVVPNSVTSIGQGAFKGCNALTSITLPFVGGSNSVTSYSSPSTNFGYIFGYTTSSTASGTTQSGSGSQRFYVPTTLKTVTITNAKGISDYAFHNYNWITTINLNNSITSIGSYAFYGCSSLSTFTIPSKVTSIGSYAFYNCSKISSITLPSGLKTISDYAFYGCKFSNFTIPASVTSIGAHAFENNTTLTEIVIPGTVLTIGDNAFSGCSNVATLSLNSGTTTIGEYSFQNLSKITSVVVPNSVTSIGQGAFKGCNALTSITLPFVGGSNSVTSYSSPSTNFGYIFGYTTSSTASGTTQSGSGSQRFYVPTTLKTVTITNAKGISDYAFHNYNWITTINLNNSITSIGSYAFYGCSSLSTFTIPSKVTSIGSYAFYNCSKISSITLPSGLKTISDYAFYGCKFSNFTIPASVTSIGAHAFENNTTLTEIVIPGTVLTIGDNAFSGCSNVATLSLNSGTTTIGEYSFQNLSKITSVVVPNSVTSIGQGAFKGCNALTSITLPFVGGSNSVTSYSSPSTNFGYIFGYTTSSTASGTTQSGSGSQRFYVPTTLKTVTITNAKGISDYAFHNYNWITTINLNNSITSIGSYAFYGCSSLSTFTIPSKVTSIGSYAFYNCSKISSITLPSGLKTISDYAFYGCKFSNFTIPASVTSIGAHAFENNTTLTEIVIPGTVLTIGDNAFSGCSNVTTLSLNSGTTTIGEYSFQNLSKITSVVVPNSVTSIGQGAFKGCNALTSITLPFVGGSNSVTSYSSPSTNFGYIFGYTTSSTASGTTQSGSGSQRFYVPTTLKTVTITNAKGISDYAFHNYNWITTINLNQACQSNTYDNSFKNCGATITYQ